MPCLCTIILSLLILGAVLVPTVLLIKEVRDSRPRRPKPPPAKVHRLHDPK